MAAVLFGTCCCLRALTQSKKPCSVFLYKWWSQNVHRFSFGYEVGVSHVVCFWGAVVSCLCLLSICFLTCYSSSALHQRILGAVKSWKCMRSLSQEVGVYCGWGYSCCKHVPSHLFSYRQTICFLLKKQWTRRTKCQQR